MRRRETELSALEMEAAVQRGAEIKDVIANVEEDPRDRHPSQELCGGRTPDLDVASAGRWLRHLAKEKPFARAEEAHQESGYV
jgi:hypothetical protein